MAVIASVKVDLRKITKEKIYKGKKGDYLEMTFVINDEVDQYGNNVSVTEGQTKEERDAKAPKNYLANGRVVWTNGTAPTVAPRDGEQAAPAQVSQPQDDDLPF